ncbi:MAG: hypothetical protein ACRCX2_29645 [Paraclostridium sp.]
MFGILVLFSILFVGCTGTNTKTGVKDIDMNRVADRSGTYNTRM